MMNLLFLLLFTGCMTNKKQLEVAKNQIYGNCLEEIEIKLMGVGCDNLEYFRGKDQYVFRCLRPDRMRKSFWDTWWFRLTSSIKEWPDEMVAEVKHHTICLDGQYRIEAYPPEE